jgi:hypothetical protein
MQQSRKYRKTNIPAALRRTVWNTYIGEDIGSTECYVGCKTKISQLTFECGHVEAESKGGFTIVENLRPICSSCNRSMGTRNMHDFMKTFGFKNDVNNNMFDWTELNSIINKSIKDTNENTNSVCIINKLSREMTIPTSIKYFIENCIEYKKNKKINFDDMYTLFYRFCPNFCDKEKVNSISKEMFINYFIDNYNVESNMLYDYKFKYEDDREDDNDNNECDEFFDTESDIIELMS